MIKYNRSFRKVDAYRTAEKFDPDGIYVKKWLS